MLSLRVDPRYVRDLTPTDYCPNLNAMLTGGVWEFSYSKRTLLLPFAPSHECGALRISPFGYVVRLPSGDIRPVPAPGLGFLVRLVGKARAIRGAFGLDDLAELNSDLEFILITIYRHALRSCPEHFPTWWKDAGLPTRRRRQRT